MTIAIGERSRPRPGAVSAMSAADADVCVIGSVNLDLVATTPRLPRPGETVLGHSYSEHPGGKGLNQAVAAVRAGARTTLCAAVGDDEPGRRLRDVARDAGLADRHLQVAPGASTGRALIAVSAEQAQNLIVVVPGANWLLEADAAARAAAGARVVLAQLEVPQATVAAALAAARSAGSTTILNPSPADTVADELIALCDHVVVNEHEAALLGGAQRILGAGARNVIVTLGAHGSVRSSADGREQAVSAFAVDVLDTTAAGDAYCGAFAAALAFGEDPHDAMWFASAAGALATTVAGAVPSLPRRDAIEVLLASTREIRT